MSTAKWKQQNPKGRRRRRRLVVFHLAVETMNKKHHGNRFFIKGRPNFWPQIENRLWVVLALNKKPALGGFFLIREPIIGHCQALPGSFFSILFQCKIQKNETQRGGTRSAPPLWGGAEGAALLFSIWQWKPGIKNLMEI